MTQDQAQAIISQLEALREDVSELKAELEELAAETRDLRAWRDRLAGGLAVVLFLLTVFGVYALDRITA